MADDDTNSGPSEAPDDEIEAEVDADVDTADVDTADVETADEAEEPVVDAPVVDEGESEPEVGRTDLKVIQARKTLEEEAEAARRRVLGPRRGRVGPATLTAPVPTDDDVNMSEHVRELVRTVEAETERLHEDVSRLRSAAGRAGATLQEEIQRAAEELSEETVEQLESAVQQTATESLDALTASVDTLQDTAAALTEVAAGLRTSVEQLVKVAPIAEQLAELAAAPPSIPDALAGILGDLTDQLSDLGDAVATQVRGAVEEGLTTELARHDARIEHALARVVDELARLRRRMPVTKRGAAVDFSKDQLEGIGKAVGDYLLAAMRDQKS